MTVTRVRAFLDAGPEPSITTGISHREAGDGQIRAGPTDAPIECLYQALQAFPEPFPAP